MVTSQCPLIFLFRSSLQVKKAGAGGYALHSFLSKKGLGAVVHVCYPSYLDGWVAEVGACLRAHLKIK